MTQFVQGQTHLEGLVLSLQEKLDDNTELLTKVQQRMDREARIREERDRLAVDLDDFHPIDLQTAKQEARRLRSLIQDEMYLKLGYDGKTWGFVCMPILHRCNVDKLRSNGFTVTAVDSSRKLKCVYNVCWSYRVADIDMKKVTGCP